MDSPHCVGQVSDRLAGLRDRVAASREPSRNRVGSNVQVRGCNMRAPEKWHIQDGRHGLAEKSPPNRRAGGTVRARAAADPDDSVDKLCIVAPMRHRSSHDLLTRFCVFFGAGSQVPTRSSFHSGALPPMLPKLDAAHAEEVRKILLAMRLSQAQLGLPVRVCVGAHPCVDLAPLRRGFLPHQPAAGARGGTSRQSVRESWGSSSGLRWHSRFYRPGSYVPSTRSGAAIAT